MEKLKNSQNKFIKFIGSILEKNNKYALPDQSAIITYYIILSIGPFLILTFSLLSYFISDNMAVITEFITDFYPDVKTFIEPIVDYLRSSNNSALAIFGIIATLFSSSKASKHIIKSITKIFEGAEKSGIKNIIFTQVYSIVFTIALIISLVAFFVFFVTGDPIAMLVDFLFGIRLDGFLLWNFIKNFAPVIYLLIFLTFLYNFLPRVTYSKDISLLEAFVGAVFVTVGWVIGSGLFSFYIKNLNKNNAMYGVLGSLMVIMIWFYFLIFMLLLGATVITIFIDYRNEKKKKKLTSQ